MNDILNQEISVSQIYQYCAAHWEVLVCAYLVLTLFIGWRAIRRTNKRKIETGCDYDGLVESSIIDVILSPIWVPFWMIHKTISVFPFNYVLKLLDIKGERL